MSRRILVPLDRSAFAEFALGWASTLTRAGDRVTLATVVDPLPDYPEYAEPLKRGVREYHEEIAAEWFGSDVDVRSEIIRGRPDLELVELVRQIDYDLVVAATHGRGALNRLWLGSVAYALARSGRVPILLIRPEEGERPAAGRRPRPRRVTVPLDGSNAAATALEVLDLLNLPEDGLVHLVRVVVPPDLLPPAYVPVPTNDLELVEQHRQAAREYLEEVRDRLEKAGRRVEVDVPSSPGVATAIVDLAARTDSDAIVVATHGRSGLARAVLGSVSDKVVRAAPCPVLVVPAGPDHA